LLDALLGGGSLGRNRRTDSPLDPQLHQQSTLLQRAEVDWGKAEFVDGGTCWSPAVRSTAAAVLC